MNDLVLVTGGCGFVGSNLVTQLLSSGYRVRVLDNLSAGNVNYLDGLDVDLRNEDITLLEEDSAAFDGVSSVIHLAAKGSVVESVVDPQDNFNVNVLGTFNVLKQCVKANVSKIIFSSTGGALIGNATPPVSELSLPRPISPYGASKLCCEAYCHAFSQSYDLKALCLRFANVYGPNSEHKSGVVNKFTQRVMAKEKITIFGDGSSTRDYIHVSDLCNGILLALENTQIEFDVLHLATGKETPLSELGELFLGFEGLGSEYIEYQPARVGEVERNFALYDYANQVLGYAPKISLASGMQETYTYLKNTYQSEV